MLLLNVQLARNLYIFAKLKNLFVLHEKNTAKPATVLHFRRIFAVQNKRSRAFIFRRIWGDYIAEKCGFFVE